MLPVAPVVEKVGSYLNWEGRAREFDRVLPAAAALYLFWRRLRLHLSILRAGRPLARTDRPLERIRGVLVYVIGQRRLLNDLGPGLMHAFIFWGFLVLFPTIVMAVIAVVSKDTKIQWLGSQGWVALLEDVFAGLVLVRQRPGTASGVVFVTLEDETGFVNVVLWESVFNCYAVLAKTVSFLGVTGRLQVEDGVVHLVAEQLWEPALPFEPTGAPSRDFH